MSTIINYVLKSSIFFLIVFILLLGCNDNSISQKKKIENIKAFVKLYGYVRWFHPSDEAQQIDWNQFVCYGVQTVENAPNSEALKDSLLKLFLPIAPALEIYNSYEKYDFDVSKNTPPDTTGYKPVFWQHSGVKLDGTPGNVYNSLRINRIDKKDYLKIPALSKIINVLKYREKNIEFRVSVKSEEGSKGNIFFELLGGHDILDLSTHLKSKSLGNTEWEVKKFEKRIKSNDEYVFIGFNNTDNSPVYINDIVLKVKDTGLGDSLIFEYNFNNYSNDLMLFNFDMNKNQPFNLQAVNKKEDRDSCILIAFNNQFKLFDEIPEMGEPISEQIHPKLKINLPIVVLVNGSHTFPVADSKNLKSLKLKLTGSFSEEYRNMGSIVVVWNVIQHFFPYFDEIEVAWEKELDLALKDFFYKNDIQKILQKLTAVLNDGHILLTTNKDKGKHCLPIKWEWIEGQLVVTEIYDSIIGLQPGCIVKKIDNQNPVKYFEEIEKYISASTYGFLKFISANVALQGTKGKNIVLKVIDESSGLRDITLNYSLNPQEWYSKSINFTRYMILDNNIYYLNLDKISLSEIDSLMPELVNCKGIVCDLRGYPNSNHEFWAHLLTQKDTAGHWLGIPQFIHPNQKNIAGYNYPNIGTGMKPTEPHINVPVVLVIDGSAISYAESVAMIVKHYSLATIVGQPTAGTNGAYNSVMLPNGTKFRYTGCKVFSFDGSQHFGIGVLPDVYVEKTIEGVRHNKDEFLIKAVEILKTKNLKTLVHLNN